MPVKSVPRMNSWLRTRATLGITGKSNPETLILNLAVPITSMALVFAEIKSVIAGSIIGTIGIFIAKCCEINVTTLPVYKRHLTGLEFRRTTR